MELYSFAFERKAVANGNIIIEGWSNRNVLDRGLERVNPKGGRYDNYRKNPIVLFDHGKDLAFGNTPVGRSIEIRPEEKGIYTKCMISNSKSDKITAVRDLIQEEILKTFSIGFENLRDVKDADGNRVIEEFELIEQSIVPIPMNQDSTFSLLQKRYSKNHFMKVFIEEKRLQAKGATEAATILNMMYQTFGPEFKKDILFNQVAKLSQTPYDIVYAAMKAEIPMPENVFKNFIFLITTKGKSMKSRAGLSIVAVSIPKDKFENQEEAQKFVESAGYKVDKMKETEEGYMFPQSDEDSDIEKSSVLNLPNGIMAFAIPQNSDNISVSDTAKEEEGKACGEMPKEDEQKAMPPIASGADALPPDDNPYLLLAKQQNALLGALIIEVQKMSQKLDGRQPEPQEPKVEVEIEEEVETEDTEEQMSKKLEILNTFRENINKSLQRMGY
jgi:HK97 family phage prohead protease